MQTHSSIPFQCVSSCKNIVWSASYQFWYIKNAVNMIKQKQKKVLTWTCMRLLSGFSGVSQNEAKQWKWRETCLENASGRSLERSCREIACRWQAQQTSLQAQSFKLSCRGFCWPGRTHVTLFISFNPYAQMCLQNVWRSNIFFYTGLHGKQGAFLDSLASLKAMLDIN